LYLHKKYFYPIGIYLSLASQLMFKGLNNKERIVMKLEVKWLKAGLGLVSASLLLAACGNGASNESSASSDTSSGASSTTSEAASSTSGEKVELTFWHAMTGPQGEALTTLVNKFNESQDQYTVVEQNQGDYTTLAQSVTAAAVSGDLPTLSQLTATDVVEYASNDLLTPITDDMLAEAGFEQDAIDDVYEGFWGSTEFNGERFAMPFSKSTRVMYYNQDLLDEYGVEVPTTWEGVTALGEKMVAAGDEAYAMGFENGFEMEWETMARQNGSDFIDPEAGTVSLNDEAAVEALTVIQESLEKGYARTAGEDGYMSTPFANGATALYIGSSAGMGFVEEGAAESGINWSTAEIPTMNDTQLTLFAGNDLGLFADASEEEQAGYLDFTTFLLEPENTAFWAQETGYLPVRESALEDADYAKYLEENPQYVAATKELPYGTASKTFVGYGEFRNNMVAAMEEIAVNGADPQTVLDNLQSQTEELVAGN
jgi:multiple sugar transport system substrate-binding protein